jgi:hypothetical protein
LPYFSKPQSEYFVILLVGVLLCQGRHTLTGLLQQISEQASVPGLSQFLIQEEEYQRSWALTVLGMAQASDKRLPFSIRSRSLVYTDDSIGIY